jgi:GT2 family glycosyltransferase
MDMMSLSFSIVIYDACRADLECFITSLTNSIRDANNFGKKIDTTIFLIDNSPLAENISTLQYIKKYVELELAEAKVDIISGHGNVGFGAGHNLSLERMNSNYHFILNSDLLFEKDTVALALCYLEKSNNSKTILMAPKLANSDGSMQYGIKIYPSVMVLMLRFMAINILSRLFSRQLVRYEERDKVGQGKIANAQIVSGCFMLFRTEAFKELGGFDERFFLYFEDFDLSLRAHEFGDVVYNPELNVTHFGGNAGRKGWKHISMFVRSAVLFFRKHGWKWF